jgi:hypothetical protein
MAVMNKGLYSQRFGVSLERDRMGESAELLPSRVTSIA